MGKVNRNGQSSVLSAKDWGKLERTCKDINAHRVIWSVMKFTGERIGAILQLQVSDVFDERGKLKAEITYRKSTRKGKDKTRQVPIHDDLALILKSYAAPTSGYLFPSPRNRHQPISYEAVLRYLKEKCLLAGLDGVTTHSGRRSFITHMARKGVDIRTIQAITGHASMENLQRYIETDPERVKRTMENFSYS